MAALTGFVSSTKGDLVRFDNSGSGITASSQLLKDGAGIASVLGLSTTACYFGNVQASGNTITSASGALTINSATTVVNLATASASTLTIGNASGTTQINGTVSFGGALSFTNLTISGTLQCATLTATSTIGTPGAGVLTNCTGLPISTGLSGAGTGVLTFLATPTSANLAAAITNETGSGLLVFATSPSLTTPLLGTPTSGNLSNCTAYPMASLTGIASLAQGGSGYSNSQALVQRVFASVTGASGTSTIPYDNTKPQNTEGSQVATASITPKNSSNKLRIIFSGTIGNTTSGAANMMALFQDSTADATTATIVYPSNGSSTNWQLPVNFEFEMAAGTTSSTTFNIRIGASSGTWTVGSTATAATLGGIMFASFTIEEYTP